MPYYTQAEINAALNPDVPRAPSPYETKTHYCHNCHHWQELVDGVHCAWCLNFWRAAHRMPRYGETLADANGR